MTDTLPRTIPTGPAEQERLMPEWVKVEWLRQMNTHNRDDLAWCKSDLVVGPFWPHALTIWEHMPEPVDPDLQIAREVCAERLPDVGSWDTAMAGAPIVDVALAAIKRGRALEREEG